MQAICKTVLPPAPAQPRKLAKLNAPPVPFHHFRSVVVPVATRRSAISVVPLLEDDFELFEEDEEGLDTIHVPPNDHESPTVRP